MISSHGKSAPLRLIAIGFPLIAFAAGCHFTGAPTMPIPGAAALTPLSKLQIEPFFGAPASEDPHWKCYKISNIPMGDDCRLAVLVDGHGDVLTNHDPASKGVEYVRYRMDDDDDRQVKTILRAQGLPIKPGTVTYRIVAGISSAPIDDGAFELGRDLHFVHGGANADITDLGMSTSLVEGVAHPLKEMLLVDNNWLGNPKRPELPPGGTSDEQIFAPYVRKNLAHHVRFVLTVIPHKARQGYDGANSLVTSI